MAASSGVGNGPYVPMYVMKPYHCLDVVSLPKVMYKVANYHDSSHKGSPLSISPLDSLQKRQDDVLKRLDQLQASVSKLAQKYSVSTEEKLCSTSATSLTATASLVTTATAVRVGSSHGQAYPAISLESKHTTPDLVISADPSSIPLSLIVLCENLSAEHRVLMSTFVHSSVADSVPDKLRALLTSNSGIKRADCNLAITLIWKKVATGLQLVVDPTKQTTIEGEANVARYLNRLLNPSHEDNIITATETDEILDLAQLQLLEGKSKEKTAAVRTLNSLLGKRDWIIGSEPSVADIVCWSALHQTNQASSPPANVKKWLNLCSQHNIFKTASGLIS